jgi:uracil-DNA glycosylase
MTKIALVGEAWGDEELRGFQQFKVPTPFVGAAGKELDRLLEDAGISRRECFVTNVLNLHPPQNKLEFLCLSKKEVGSGYHLSPIKQGKYLRQEYLPELDRLKEELLRVRPNVVVALGNTACWALLRNSGITKLRGTVCESAIIPGLKVLPTYHPSAILHQYELRAVTVIDLIKAKRESNFPEINVFPREIHVAEDLVDLCHIERLYCEDDRETSLDIETLNHQISCIGFSHDITRAHVIPFIHLGRPGGNYWQDPTLERHAWLTTAAICRSNSAKIGQNGLFDLTHLLQTYGISVPRYSEDTMLLHHALQPELPKSLGFLGSVYCNERAWKNLRPKYSEKLKRDE